MAKQPEDTATIDLALPRKPGRRPKYTSAAERQAAYRHRQAVAQNDSVISLRNEIEQLKSALADAQQKLAARPVVDDRKTWSLERKVRALESELDLHKTRKSDRLQQLLARRFIMPARDLGAVFLVDFAGQPIERGDEFDRATKRALELGRKAAAAVSTINNAIDTLASKQQVSFDERAILDAAAKILGDVHGRSTWIKERAKASAEQAKRVEAAREKAARDAVEKVFPGMEQYALQVAFFMGDRSNYSLGKLMQMRPDTVGRRDLEYHLGELAKDMCTALRRRVEKAIAAGEDADQAAEIIKAEFEAVRARIEADNRRMIENLAACRVAGRLVEANDNDN